MSLRIIFIPLHLLSVLFHAENVHQQLNTRAWESSSSLIINVPQICFPPVVSEFLQVDQQEKKNYKKGEP